MYKGILFPLRSEVFTFSSVDLNQVAVRRGTQRSGWDGVGAGQWRPSDGTRRDGELRADDNIVQQPKVTFCCNLVYTMFFNGFGNMSKDTGSILIPPIIRQLLKKM